MHLSTPSSRKLADRIKAAIADGRLTEAEYAEIVAVADEDHVIDPIEKALLDELLHLIENGSVKRVP